MEPLGSLMIWFDVVWCALIWFGLFDATAYLTGHKPITSLLMNFCVRLKRCLCMFFFLSCLRSYHHESSMWFYLAYCFSPLCENSMPKWFASKSTVNIMQIPKVTHHFGSFVHLPEWNSKRFVGALMFRKRFFLFVWLVCLVNQKRTIYVFAERKQRTNHAFSNQLNNIQFCNSNKKKMKKIEMTSQPLLPWTANIANSSTSNEPKTVNFFESVYAVEPWNCSYGHIDCESI